LKPGKKGKVGSIDLEIVNRHQESSKEELSHSEKNLMYDITTFISKTKYAQVLNHSEHEVECADTITSNLHRMRNSIVFWDRHQGCNNHAFSASLKM
jgi:hypothetical protein